MSNANETILMPSKSMILEVLRTIKPGYITTRWDLVILRRDSEGMPRWIVGNSISIYGVGMEVEATITRIQELLQDRADK